MNVKSIFPASCGLRGEITIPGDKSISHRSVMLGAISKGTTEITGFLNGADCLSTIACFQSMGIEIEEVPSTASSNPLASSTASSGRILVHGKGLHGLSAPSKTLNTGNSGTTTRLLSGILSGQRFSSLLSGDASLNTRPMKRIMTPLNAMGAHIESLNGNGCAPLLINPGSLHGINYSSPVASAQVKSAILLAGLYANDPVSVTEPSLSRDHTERMLQSFGASLSSRTFPDGQATATILPCQELYGQEIAIPGDISSAAYFIAAALLVPDSELLIKNVGINPTRAGFLAVCKAMGADLTYLNQNITGGEEHADILVRSSQLYATTIEGSLIPTLIDEIPILAVMAAHAEGTTIIRDAAELKVKETNRIDTITTNLRAMGCDITPTEDGMIIEGGHRITKVPLHPAVISSFLDHRIAMVFSIAALLAQNTAAQTQEQSATQILESQCIDVSYPNFFSTLESCF